MYKCSLFCDRTRSHFLNVTVFLLLRASFVKVTHVTFAFPPILEMNIAT